MRFLKHLQQRLLGVHQNQPLRRRLDHLRSRARPEGLDPSAVVDLGHGADRADVAVAAEVGLPDLEKVFVLFCFCFRRGKRSKKKKKKKLFFLFCTSNSSQNTSSPQEASPSSQLRNTAIPDQAPRLAREARRSLRARQGQRASTSAAAEGAAKRKKMFSSSSSSPSTSQTTTTLPMAAEGTSRPGAAAAAAWFLKKAIDFVFYDFVSVSSKQFAAEFAGSCPEIRRE